MCLYSKLIPNRKYTANKKNGGIIPPVRDDRAKWVPIGCGQCMECRKQKSREWQIRMLEDIKHNTNGKFITLTFSNESIKILSKEIKFKGYALDNQIATLAVRRFLERWRKKHKTSLRHWLVTELGHQGTENIHLHGIVWTNAELKTVEQYWQYGHIWKGKEINGKIINYVSERTVNYVVKYVSKIDHAHKNYKPIILTSAGIGKDYLKTYNSRLNKYKGSNTVETYRTSTGHKIALPIYWRNKIYSEDEKEKLWLQRLDKNERWVCGERVCIKNGLKNYFSLINYYQKINIRLGYRSDEKNWNQIQYENELRQLKIEKRIAKVIAMENHKTPVIKLLPGEKLYEYKHATW